MVTGIRHWSTSTYTRVAIDLGNQVEFEAARVKDPDRIYFDLHNAHLAADLAGKSFTVTDGGFLTRIRAAQISPELTRVVLDVHDLKQYSAFLLPNPYRLIIDIHGIPDSHAKPHPQHLQLRRPVPAPSHCAHQHHRSRRSLLTSHPCLSHRVGARRRQPRTQQRSPAHTRPTFA